MSDSDTLVQHAFNGDEDAMTRLLEQHGPEIERSLSISREWQSVLDPADIMQVTYLEAYLQAPRYSADRSGPFPVWLRRIAENNLRDAIRGLGRQKRPQPSKRVQPVPDGNSTADLLVMLGVDTATPSRFASEEERLSRLNAALDSLPDDYAKAIRLYDLESLPIAEVSQRMGRSPGAVHMLRARAHDWLRGILGGESAWFSRSA